MKHVTVNDYARLLLSVTQETAGSKLDETVRKVLDLMHARGDAALAQKLPEAVLRMASMDGNEVMVTMATEDDRIKTAAAKALDRREEEICLATDPSLIAGATVRVGHTVIDASLSGTLKRLSTHLFKS